MASECNEASTLAAYNSGRLSTLGDIVALSHQLGYKNGVLALTYDFLAVQVVPQVGHFHKRVSDVHDLLQRINLREMQC